jgi:O-antigen/teichoic acid export membrane protein
VRQISYRATMARAEVAMTLLSTLVVVTICMISARLFWSALTPSVCLAFGIALLGLWWREFVRQMKFAILRYDHALIVDLVYFLVTAGGTACVLASSNFTTSAVFWCMGVGGIMATTAPLVSAVRGVDVQMSAIKQDVLMSWRMGRWEVLGSVITWAYAQSYVYFAAIHGGLDAAAEISAGRLLATPLSLMWTSYANVLRPSASRLLTSGSHMEIRKLALRSALFVAASSMVYAMVIFAVIPILDKSLFGGKFQQLRPLTMWWIVYFMLAGISTVASSVLRSALEFRQVFHRQVVSCIAAVVLLTAGLKLQRIESLVIALVLVEAISVGLFWHRLNITVSLRSKSA